MKRGDAYVGVGINSESNRISTYNSTVNLVLHKAIKNN
jgi:hypothetical protein